MSDTRNLLDGDNNRGLRPALNDVEGGIEIGRQQYLNNEIYPRGDSCRNDLIDDRIKTEPKPNKAKHDDISSRLLR